MQDIYTGVKIVSLPAMRVARYVIVSPAPEFDVINHMEWWGEHSGLLGYPGYEKRLIGWDFPFISDEQKKFGMRGYVAAYVVPEDFAPKCDGAELTVIPAETFGMLTITEPHTASFERIPTGYQRLVAGVKALGYAQKPWENYLEFEEQYDRDGVQYMDVYMTVAKQA